MKPIWFVGPINGDPSKFARIMDMARRHNIKQIGQVGPLGIRSEGSCPISYHLHKMKRQMKLGDLPTMYCGGGKDDNWKGWTAKRTKASQYLISPHVYAAVPGATFYFGGIKYIFTGAAGSDKALISNGLLPGPYPSPWSISELRKALMGTDKVVVLGEDVPYEVGGSVGGEFATSHMLSRVMAPLTKRPILWVYSRAGVSHFCSWKDTTYLGCGPDTLWQFDGAQVREIPIK